MARTPEGIIDRSEERERGIAWAAKQAASELAPSEPAGPARVVAAVATGSLPVSSVQGLLEKWSALAGRLKDKSAEESHSLNTREAFRWESMQWMVEDCIKDLRAEAGCADERQPEENTKITNSGA